MPQEIGRRIFPFIFGVIVAAGIIAAASPCQASVDAWLSTNMAAPGESVELFIKAEGTTGGKPDITPVEKDFDVISSSSSTNLSLINGRISSSKLYQYTIVPKKTGRLVIPPLDVDGEKTPELLLTVKSNHNPSKQDRASPDLFIEMRCRPEEPFIQQQVLCTVELFHASEITEGSLSDPLSNDAIIKRIGKDEHLSRRKNGRRYRVVVRRYALFPQKSGKITITAPLFQGEVAIPGKTSPLFPRDPFFNPLLPGGGIQTRHVRRTGRDIVLDVKPLPRNFTGGTWLPAKSLALSEKWAPKSTEVKSGEPITRTITITAQGLSAEQLPDLSEITADGFGIYADRPEEKNSSSKEGITGQKTIKIAYIPQKSGNLRIPALHIRWWDTENNRPMIAELPERKIHVTGPTNSAQDTSSKEGTQEDELSKNAPDPSKKLDELEGIGLPTASDGGIKNEIRLYRWLAILLCGAWLITLALLLHERKRRLEAQTQLEDTKSKKGPRHMTSRRRVAELKKEAISCCKANQARCAKDALLQLGAELWPDSPPAGLSELAQKVSDAALKIEIKELERALYSQKGRAWERGAELSALIEKLQPEPAKRKERKAGLPPLYPEC